MNVPDSEYEAFEKETYAKTWLTMNSNPVFRFPILKLFYVSGIRFALWAVRLARRIKAVEE